MSKCDLAEKKISDNSDVRLKSYGKFKISNMLLLLSDLLERLGELVEWTVVGRFGLADRFGLVGGGGYKRGGRVNGISVAAQAAGHQGGTAWGT